MKASKRNLIRHSKRTERNWTAPPKVSKYAAKNGRGETHVDSVQVHDLAANLAALAEKFNG